MAEASVLIVVHVALKLERTCACATNAKVKIAVSGSQEIRPAKCLFGPHPEATITEVHSIFLSHRLHARKHTCQS